MKHSKRSKNKIILLASIALLTLTVVGTVAILVTNTGSVKNTFQPSQACCEVQNNGEEYTIENTSDIAAYVRAAVVVTWVSKTDTNTILGTAPSYTVSADDWVEKDGYYYWPERLEKDTATANNKPLTVSCSETAPAGYKLSVEIVAQAIQADGGSVVENVFTPAVTQAWGIAVENGVLVN